MVRSCLNAHSRKGALFNTCCQAGIVGIKRKHRLSGFAFQSDVHILLFQRCDACMASGRHRWQNRHYGEVYALGVLCMRGPGPGWFSGRCTAPGFPDVAGSPNIGLGVPLLPEEKAHRPLLHVFTLGPGVRIYAVTRAQWKHAGSVSTSICVYGTGCEALAVPYWLKGLRVLKGGPLAVLPCLPVLLRRRAAGLCKSSSG